MNRRPINRELSLFLLAFLLALVLRFAGLGSAPLSDPEARLALQAASLAKGQPVLLDPHPLYVLWTSAVMFVFGGTNSAARALPALAGSLLVWVPFLFRCRLGRVPALLAAFFIAFDPGLLALSRQAGSPILAVSAALLALALFQAGSPALAGACAGLALLGGPSIWQGVLVLVAALLLYRFFNLAPDDRQDGDGELSSPVGLFSADLRLAGVAALAAVLAAGTLFFTVPAGLSAMAASLPVYLASLVTPSGPAPALLAWALIGYEIFALVLALIAAVIFWKVKTTRFLAAWLLAALVLAILPPGRLVSGLGWALLPLIALASLLLARLGRVETGERLLTAGHALLSLVIMVFIFLNLSRVAGPGAPGPARFEDWVGLGGVILLLFLTSLLVAWGWSGRVAVYGLAWSAAAALLLITLAAAWNVTGLAGRGRAELWAEGPAFSGADLLLKTVNDISISQKGGPGRLELVVVDVPSPALQWLLRGEQRASFIDSLPATASPDLVITAGEQQVALSSDYRGSAFILSKAPTWAMADLDEWYRWMFFGTAGSESHEVILWARNSLFPADEVKNPGSAVP